MASRISLTTEKTHDPICTSVSKMLVWLVEERAGGGEESVWLKEGEGVGEVTISNGRRVGVVVAVVVAAVKKDRRVSTSTEVEEKIGGGRGGDSS